MKELVKKNRSYRRFDESHTLSQELLRELVDCARLTPSGMNKQPLKYFTSWTQDINDKIFETLSWAGYLTDWAGPVAGERPTGYVVILGDKTITENFGCDHGIAAQTILLAAAERGLGGCMIGSVRRAKLRELLKLPEHFEILLVIALGKPNETVVLDDAANDDIKYWRDDKDVHHVPKRLLTDILIH